MSKDRDARGDWLTSRDKASSALAWLSLIRMCKVFILRLYLVYGKTMILDMEDTAFWIFWHFISFLKILLNWLAVWFLAIECPYIYLSGIYNILNLVCLGHYTHAWYAPRLNFLIDHYAYILVSFISFII